MKRTNRAFISLALAAGLLSSCASGAPVPLTPGTYYVSIAMSDDRNEAVARAQAEENADRHCNFRDLSPEILDSRVIESPDGQKDSLDLIFRCGAEGGVSQR
ncbi:MAG: hypothetical protein V3S07_02290 [Micropepsaceae bacterium]